jgi:hypothetical protein
MPLPSRPYLPEPVNLNHPLARGLVGWWLVYPGLGGGQVWWDLANQNHGILNSMTASTNGWNGTTRPGGFGSMLFDGSASYVSMPHQIDLMLNTSTITVSAWAYANGSSFPATDIGIVSSVFDGECVFTLAGYHDSGGGGSKQVSAGFYNGGWNVVTQSDSWSFGTWNHVVGTYNQSNLSIYINGVLNNTRSMGVALPSGAMGWRIGRRWDQPNIWNGYIDDVRIYNRALSSAEVFDLYTNSRLGYPGLLNQTETTNKFWLNIYNEAMSGGVLGGTAAIVQTTYSPSIASAGVWAADSAVYSQSFGNVNGSGGAYANGSSIYYAAFNWTASGGVSIAASAVVAATYDLDPLASAGILAGDSAPVTATYNDAITSAGVWTSDTGIAEETDTIVASGGSLLSGSAVVAASYDLDPLASAGLWAGATGVYAATFIPPIVSAGAGLNGSAIVATTYNDTIVSAGVLAAGFAGIETTYELDPLASAGVLGGSSAPTTANYNPSLTPAGLLVTGTADNATTYSLSMTPAGVLAGGAAINTDDDSPVIVPAGVNAGGAAIIGIQPFISGGAVLNGTSPTAADYNVLGSGGLLASGHATRIYNVTASGGAVMGDSADAGFQYDIVMAGGLMAADAEAGVVYNPAFRVYRKFNIGDIVYVPTAFHDRYIPQAVRGFFTNNTSVFYDVGIGRFAENRLMTCGEYRAMLCKKATVYSRFSTCPVGRQVTR